MPSSDALPNQVDLVDTLAARGAAARHFQRRVTDVSYALDGTIYRIVVTDDVIAAPGFSWAGEHFGTRLAPDTFWMKEHLGLTARRIKGRDRDNLIQAIQMAVEAHASGDSSLGRR